VNYRGVLTQIGSSSAWLHALEIASQVAAAPQQAHSISLSLNRSVRREPQQHAAASELLIPSAPRRFCRKPARRLVSFSAVIARFTSTCVHLR